MTLGLCILGIAGAILLGAKRGAAIAGLGTVFVCAALRQIVLLYRGDLPPLELGTGLLGELALLGLALGGLAALRALHRTTHERDRAEDLHWDSMEAVRVMSDLAARPGASLEDKLATMLDLGTSRFGLELGVAWLEDDDAGRVLGARAPGVPPEQRDALLACLEPHLRDACHAARPVLRLDGATAPHTFLGVSVSSGGTIHGALAFVGLSDAGNRFTATDKDLLGLMAQWLASEIERQQRKAEPAVAATPRPHLAQVARDAFHPRRGYDLNRVVTRLERKLRQRVGTDGSLELSLGESLPPVDRGQLSLPRLVESVVDAAARLAPTGRIRLSTQQTGDEGSEVTLCVRVDAPEIDGDALRRLFAEPTDGEIATHGTLPLARVERLLRSDGGALSVDVEPERGALLTAWLPALPVASATDTAPGRARPPSQPSR